MAELILSAIGLVLSGPALATALVRAGEELHGFIKRLTDAPSAIRDIGAFGYELHKGKLKLDFDLATWAFSLEELDPLLKDALEDYLVQLRSALLDTDIILRSLSDSRGNARRFYFTMFGERKAMRQLRVLEKWQSDFAGIIELIGKKQLLLPNDLLLSNTKLKLIHKPNDQTYIPIASDSRLFLARAEYMDPDVREIGALIERMPADGETSMDELKAVASYLATRLNIDSSNHGILRCLGYRQDENFELVFKVPETLHNPRLLQSVIASTSGIYGMYPLEARFRLCREICEAVLSVHTSRLVHKNIRPDTVLLLEETTTSSFSQKFPCERRLGSPFLTTWSMLRKSSGLSSRRGEDDWMKDIYRHPQRQGLQPEDKYNIGHDIYSLGVTLLEIALWEPFIQRNRSPEISERFQAMAVELNYVSPEDSDSIRKLTSPRFVKSVMLALAKQEVPPRMGSNLAGLIEACLTCLDGGMGDVEAFKADLCAAAVSFHEVVAQTFSNISY